MKDLTNMTYAELLEIRVELNNKITEVEIAAEESLLKGNAVEGFRLKAGRQVRKIKHEGTLAQQLRDLGLKNSDFYQAKMMGIPALEKLLVNSNLSKDNLTKHIEVSNADPKLEYVGNKEDE